MAPAPADAAKQANEKMAKAWCDYQGTCMAKLGQDKEANMRSEVKAKTSGGLAVRYQEHIKDFGNSGYRTMVLGPGSEAYAAVDRSKGGQDLLVQFQGILKLKVETEIAQSNPYNA
jgi:hypothetical protein